MSDKSKIAIEAIKALRAAADLLDTGDGVITTSSSRDIYPLSGQFVHVEIHGYGVLANFRWVDHGKT